MKAKDIMRTSVSSVLPCTPISSVLAIIVEKQTNVVAISNEQGALLGIVSEGDILRRNDNSYSKSRGHWMSQVADGEPLNLEFLHRLNICDRNVGEIMSRPVISVGMNTTLRDVLDTLVTKGIRQALVTKNSRLVGMVTRSDAIKAMMPHGANPPARRCQRSKS